MTLAVERDVKQQINPMVVHPRSIVMLKQLVKSASRVVACINRRLTD